MISAIIIDDEIHNVKTVPHLLDMLPIEVVIIGYADSVQSGYDEIISLSPDLIFLDIQLGDGTGFDLLSKFSVINFEVIFITAYNQYQTKVKELGLYDYLLKPIDVNLLEEALFKIENRLQLRNVKRILKFKQILIPITNGLQFIHIDNIVVCESVTGEKKTKVYLNNGSLIIVNRILKYFDRQLNPFSFLRVHASFIVNANYIEKYINGDGGILIMKNGIKASVSRSYRQVLMDYIQNDDNGILPDF